MASDQDIEARLGAFVEGDLDGPARAEVEQYLAQNPRERQLVDELIRARGVLRELPSEVPPPEIAEAFARHLERAALLGDASPQEQYRSNVNRWRRIRAAAAILILAGGLAAVVVLILPRNGPKSYSSATPGLGSGPGQQGQAPGGSQLATTPPVNSPEAISQSETGQAPAGVAVQQQQQVPAGAVVNSQFVRQKSLDQLAARAGLAEAGKDATDGVVPLADDEGATRTLINGGAGTMRSVRDVALAADAVHMTMRQRSQQPSDGGAIYVVLRGSDAGAQVKRVQSQLDAAAIAWTDVPMAGTAGANLAGELGAVQANAGPTTQGAVAMNYRAALESAENSAAAPTSQPAAGGEQRRGQANGGAEVNSAGNAAGNSNANFSGNAAANPSMNESTSPGAAPASVAATTIIWAHDVQRSNAQQVATELSELASPGVVGADVFPALTPAIAAGGDIKAPSTQPVLGASKSTTQGAGELLAVGQSVTLIARDPLVSNSEVYHEAQQIDSDGNVAVPVVGRVRAAGLTANDLQQSINRVYGDGQQAARVDWQVMTQRVSATPATGPIAGPTTEPAEGGAAETGPTEGGATDRSSTIAGAPTTMPTTEPATMATAANGMGSAAVDLVIVIRQSGQPTANNQPPTTQAAPAGNLPRAGETEPGITTPAAAPAATPPAGMAPPASPAATEPSPVPPAPALPTSGPAR